MNYGVDFDICLASGRYYKTTLAHQVTGPLLVSCLKWQWNIRSGYFGYFWPSVIWLFIFYFFGSSHWRQIRFGSGVRGGQVNTRSSSICSGAIRYQQQILFTLPVRSLLWLIGVFQSKCFQFCYSQDNLHKNGLLN